MDWVTDINCGDCKLLRVRTPAREIAKMIERGDKLLRLEGMKGPAYVKADTIKYFHSFDLFGVGKKGVS